jgi:hypothetical protein
MESVYHIVAIRVNETSWAHIWRLRSRYLETGYDSQAPSAQPKQLVKRRMTSSLCEDSSPKDSPPRGVTPSTLEDLSA